MTSSYTRSSRSWNQIHTEDQILNIQATLAELCVDVLRPGFWSKSKDRGIIQAGKLRDLQVPGPQKDLHLPPRLQDAPRLLLRPVHTHKENGEINLESLCQQSI
ncbi:hypothetical protein E2I00_000342 [Balaenoptera physalus]|uniref:Uncharacterized protein n=1 Tax=Balaenoptera physalus TaxID=9770 RepID=A0A6A1QBN4_BALPH|nr:hypothetical protein E2I00_000342 [Balaenoptera physalus]